MTLTHTVTDPTSAPARARILVVCPFVPHANLPHAGGQYLYAHLRALRQRYDCELVVPDTPDNRQALADGGQEFDPVLVPVPAPRRPRLARVGELAGNLLQPLRPPAPLRRALLAYAGGRLAGVSAVELQWPEYAGLLPALRALAPEIPVVVVEHDVLSQRVARDRVVGVTVRTRLRARLTARRVARQERSVLDRADRVLVFSAKDVDLLRGNGVSSSLEVVLPPLEDPRMRDLVVTREPRRRVLFVAAFDREVNDAAARWFVAEVFPYVRAQVPDATLVLAGARMRPALAALVAAAPGVEVTGYVTDLGAVYRDADVAVAPLLAGAGLKFKVATAMMWGLPVVSTSVGAEGYPTDRGLLAGLADDPRAFAAAVVTALTDGPATSRTAAAGRDWALATFSQATFEEHLHALYGELLAVGRSGAA